MRVIYAGTILQFCEPEDIVICIDYLDKHHTLSHKSSFYVTQTNDNVLALTVRYYKTCKTKPKNGITTYAEFQQFDLQDFCHTTNELAKAETYTVKNLVLSYTEQKHGNMIGLTVHFDNNVDTKMQLRIDNCKANIVEYKKISSTATYLIKVNDAMIECDDIQYMLVDTNFACNISNTKPSQF